MEMNTFLFIILGLCSATGSGLLFWMALQNFEGINHKLTYVIILSLFLTPAGAWFFSNFYRLSKSFSALKQNKNQVPIFRSTVEAPLEIITTPLLKETA